MDWVQKQLWRIIVLSQAKIDEINDKKIKLSKIRIGHFSNFFKNLHMYFRQITSKGILSSEKPASSQFINS